MKKFIHEKDFKLFRDAGIRRLVAAGSTEVAVVDFTEAVPCMPDVSTAAATAAATANNGDSLGSWGRDVEGISARRFRRLM